MDAAAQSMRDAGHQLRWAFKRHLFRRQAGRCYLCRREMYLVKGACNRKPRRNAATFDHVVPLAAGGSPYKDNVKLACWQCNNDKGRLLPSEYLAIRDVAQPG